MNLEIAKMENNLGKEKKVAWEAENKDAGLLAREGAEKYFKTEFPDLRRAFLKNLQCVVCMDEGTAHMDYNGEAKLCMAGSGMLFPAASGEERIKKVAELLSQTGVANVTSHSGCGAAGLAYKRDFPNSNPTSEQIEDYARQWAQKVAEELGRLGHQEKFDHIVAEEMARPPEFHNARLVYYDGVGGFNPNKEIGLPMGFVISRKFIPADYAAEELKVAVAIAFGRHGFGEFFSKELPFVVIAMAGSQEEVESLKKEAESILKDSHDYQEGKIKIDGLMVL